MRCPGCDAEISDEAQYCPYCGMQIPRGGPGGAAPSPVYRLRRAIGSVAGKLQRRAPPRCPNCGAELGPGTRFCTYCGYAMEGPQ